MPHVQISLKTVMAFSVPFFKFLVYWIRMFFTPCHFFILIFTNHGIRYGVSKPKSNKCYFATLVPMRQITPCFIYLLMWIEIFINH